MERLDIVPVSGGYATMQNGMKAGMNREILPLDENGQAVFELGVDQTAQLLSGENALKTVTFTAEQDGTMYEADPLNGFVLNLCCLTSCATRQDHTVRQHSLRVLRSTSLTRWI